MITCVVRTHIKDFIIVPKKQKTGLNIFHIT